MDAKLLELNCPACKKPVSYTNEEHKVICSNCEKNLTLVWHNGKVVSIRRYISSITPPSNEKEEMIENFVACIESNFSFKKWGFVKNNLFSHDVIYDSDSCRVKFTLGVNYYPMLDTQIYYGRLHASDSNNNYMIWNGERCRCWHNLNLILPFIEGIKVESVEEFWRNLKENLNLDFPPHDFIEYPLRFNSKIWGLYGNKIFDVFDIRNTDLWEKYSQFSNARHEFQIKKYNSTYRSAEKIC